MPVEAVDKDLSDQGYGTIKVVHQNGSHRLKYFAISGPRRQVPSTQCEPGPHFQLPGADTIEDGRLELYEFPLELGTGIPSVTPRAQSQPSTASL